MLLLLGFLGAVALAIVLVESLRGPGEHAGPPPAADGDVLVLRLGAPPAEMRQVAEAGVHLVHDDESLADIARDVLGDASLAPELARLNGIEDVDALLAPGTVVLLR